MSATDTPHVGDPCTAGCYGGWFTCRCRTLCDGPLSLREPLEFSRAISHYLMAVLECRIQCTEQLGKFPRDTEDDILTSYFRYLQFSYFQCEQPRGVRCVAHHDRQPPPLPLPLPHTTPLPPAALSLPRTTPPNTTTSPSHHSSHLSLSLASLPSLSPPLPPPPPVKDHKKAVQAFVIQQRLGPETDEIRNNLKAYSKMANVTKEDWEGRKVHHLQQPWQLVVQQQPWQLVVQQQPWQLVVLQQPWQLVVQQQPWQLVVLQQPWQLVVLQQPWQLVVLQQPWQLVVLQQPWQLVVLQQPWQLVVLQQPWQLVVQQQPWQLVVLQQPWQLVVLQQPWQLVVLQQPWQLVVLQQPWQLVVLQQPWQLVVLQQPWQLVVLQQPWQLVVLQQPWQLVVLQQPWQLVVYGVFYRECIWLCPITSLHFTLTSPHLTPPHLPCRMLFMLWSSCKMRKHCLPFCGGFPSLTPTRPHPQRQGTAWTSSCWTRTTLITQLDWCRPSH